MGSKISDINEVLENIGHLKFEDQAYIAEVLSKRLTEFKRSQIAKRTTEAEQAYKEGKTKKGSSKDLWKDLND